MLCPQSTHYVPPLDGNQAQQYYFILYFKHQKYQNYILIYYRINIGENSRSGNKRMAVP
jgi:hypothetical protein